MHKKNPCPASALATLIWVAALQGCATTTATAPATTPSQVAPLSSEPVAASEKALTVENLLRWPLEGPAGVDKVTMALQQTYKMASVRDGYRVERLAVLADNHVLSFASVRKLTGAIHLGLQEEPCYPPEQAAALIGAIADPAIRDAHGMDRGKTFEATKNGVMVYFNTTPITYRCLTSIHIRPVQKEGTPSQATSPSSKPVAASKNALTVENLLRWPLEGPAGVVRTGTELRRSFPGFKPLPPADLRRDGPMQLADGYILSFVWIGVPSETLNIGLESEPCLSPVRAAEISGAVLSPVYQDAHGVDRGRNYDAQGNGVRVSFTTTPETYRCVTSINVHPIKKTAR